MSAVLKQLVADLGELGRISDEEGKLTRTFLSPAMKRATEFVSARMQAAGMMVRIDSVGNVIARLESVVPDAQTLLLGSHLDTVRDAGKFDGPLGVLLPIAALAEIRNRGVPLPFHVEVIGFSEEEGVRFASAYLGSKGYLGKLTRRDLDVRDADGISAREAIERWNGLTSGRSERAEVSTLHRKRRDLLGYIEVHIEQGPVLEAEELAVGVVSAIAGQSRFKLTWTGKAGHAGTTPMKLRRDALAGAAEFTLAAEKLASVSRDGLVATVGAMNVAPGAANVIPGSVVHTLDVRHANDAARKKALLALEKTAAQIAKRRGLKVSWQRTQDNGAVACSPELTDQLARVVKLVQGRSLSLVSGAGHDGVVMSQLTEIAMLFVRCRDGLSHHPDEYASPKDIGVALEVIVEFLLLLSEQQQV